MRVVLDACVLVPTVLREMLLGVAAAGLFTPLWSPRIIGEWTRAVARQGEGPGAVAEAEAAALLARWPGSMVPEPTALSPEVTAALDATTFPDPADRHVIEAAVAGRATLIVTRNIRDFPPALLARFGLSAQHPDPFLLAMWRERPDAVAAVAKDVLAHWQRLSGEEIGLRALMKRAGLPRLGKALSS